MHPLYLVDLRATKTLTEVLDLKVQTKLVDVIVGPTAQPFTWLPLVLLLVSVTYGASHLLLSPMEVELSSSLI